jgi:hypothetical protein
MLGFLATKLFQPFLKPLKYFVDDNFRSKVEPIDGSVLYSIYMLRLNIRGFMLAMDRFLILSSIVCSKAKVPSV